ncbi:MAG TPA: LysR family transcriptional regulator [Thermoplasmata archaeon]|jgi:molybdate transport repressor ModE-like protein
MMEVRARVVFVYEGHEVTHRQMEALVALHEKGSMKKAAEHLGLSTPVLHKYVREIEEKLDSPLVSSTSRGSTLTGDGLELVKRFRAYELRLQDDKMLRVAATLVSQRAVLSAATELSNDGRPCRVTIADDETNLRAMDEGRLDCLVLDDALYAMERATEVPSAEIGSDMLVQRETGRKYAQLTFGAQRLGFQFLKERDVPYEIARTIREPTMIDRTDLSYFVNHSLIRTGIVRAEGAKDLKWSVHSIVALQCTDHYDVPAFVEEAREGWIYRKG